MNRYLHDTMDQTICGWVERGERLLVLAQDGKGEVKLILQCIDQSNQKLCSIMLSTFKASSRERAAH